MKHSISFFFFDKKQKIFKDRNKSFQQVMLPHCKQNIKKKNENDSVSEIYNLVNDKFQFKPIANDFPKTEM